MADIKGRIVFPIIGALLIVILFANFFIVVAPTYQKVKHGSERDTGMIPKRANNVDFIYLPTDNTVGSRYPIQLANGTIKRVKIAKFSQCPIFRVTDDNKSVIVG